jgi:hypothetical protein
LTLAELKSYCEGTYTFKYTELEIFKQFYDKFKYISKFGASSQYFTEDWIKVFFPTEKKAGFWNAKTKTCTGTIGLNVKIMTSVLGFEAQLQKYVVGAKV